MTADLSWLDELDARVERVTSGVSYIEPKDYDALVAAVRAGLALADELAELGDLNDDRSAEHAQAGREVDAQYRLGRSISYTQAATKLRAALGGPLTAATDEEEQA